MRQALVLICVLVLAGCSNGVEYLDYPTPPELADCKFYRLIKNGSSINVVRCPNSTVTTQQRVGKTEKRVVVIDGEQYVSQEPALVDQPRN